MPEMIIDGKKIHYNPGETVLQAAGAAGIDIPSLCCHPGLSPYGSCRLCLVEVIEGGKTGLMASCNLPANDKLVVKSSSARVMKARRLVVGLLLARCPESTLLRNLAEKFGAMKFSSNEKSECILCGRCVSACKAVGKSVLGFSYRGQNRRVSVPFNKPPGDCTVCRACEQVCPLNLIKVVEERGKVTIHPWQAESDIVKCVKCHRIIGSQKQLSELKNQLGVDFFSELCSSCRRKFHASFMR